MKDKEAVDYVKSVIKNSEKVIFAGQPVNELRLYTTDKGLEMLKRVVELADREPCEDCKSTQSVIKAMYDLCADGKNRTDNPWRDNPHIDAIIDAIENLPSVKPKVVPIAEIRFDDDKLHEIVDEAVKNIEIELGWIPIKTRPLTEEEKAEMDTESPYMYDCPLPEDGEEVEVTTYLGDVTLDVFCRDSSNGCYFEHYCDDGDVLAWRHKPEPYKAESEDKE